MAAQTNLVLGTGAGIGASFVLNGTDLVGVIKVTTGTNTVGGVVFTFEAGRTFGRNIVVQVVPANAVTAALGVGMTYVDQSESTKETWKLHSPLALAPLTEFAWTYSVVGFVL